MKHKEEECLVQLLDFLEEAKCEEPKKLKFLYNLFYYANLYYLTNYN
jgi:hypothetical protein